MTGVAELYLFLRRPYSHDAQTRLKALFRRDHDDKKTRFVVLSWKRTGSNLLCGILHNHPEITMHNELFNPIDIFSYYPKITHMNYECDDAAVGGGGGGKTPKWTPLARELDPSSFLSHIWSGRYTTGDEIKPGSTAVGFKSFPDHWPWKNEDIWKQYILEDHRIKKIILYTEDELAVYVSMKRAEMTGSYMTRKYPMDLKLHIDPVLFQVFVNNYRDTFQRKYKSPTQRRDSFHITYEQLTDDEIFTESISPLLWQFLGIDENVTPTKLKETVRQSTKDENLASIISNFDELEFCFRHTDLKHFASPNPLGAIEDEPARGDKESNMHKRADRGWGGFNRPHPKWSILLPITSKSIRGGQVP